MKAGTETDTKGGIHRRREVGEREWKGERERGRER